MCEAVGVGPAFIFSVLYAGSSESLSACHVPGSWVQGPEDGQVQARFSGRPMCEGTGCQWGRVGLVALVAE